MKIWRLGNLPKFLKYFKKKLCFSIIFKLELYFCIKLIKIKIFKEQKQRHPPYICGFKCIRPEQSYR